MSENKSLFKDYLELSKVKITFAVSLTTIAGYGLAFGQFSTGMILPTLGLFLIACGSAALNQYQERKLDASMQRTQSRPIPSGRISEKHAQLFILIITTIGSLTILLSSNVAALLLALLALIWYNFIYTPLKRKSAFAVVPGSVIGALPPAVGWVAAGGSIGDPKMILLSFFFFIWQIPHFWLLLMKYGRDYEKAGFPSLTSIYNEKQLKRITFLWTFATAVSALFIPYFNISTSHFAQISITLVAIGLIISFSSLLSNNNVFIGKKYFLFINFFLLAILISIYVDVVI